MLRENERISLFMQPLLMIGWACGLLIVSPTSDQKGRKAIFMKMTSLQIAVIILSLLFIQTQDQIDDSNQFIFMFLIFLLGVTRANNMVGLVLAVEHFPKRYAPIICTLKNSFEHLMNLSWPIYFQSLTSPKYFWLPIVWIFGMILCTYSARQVIKESPYWSLSKGYYKKLLEYF